MPHRQLQNSGRQRLRSLLMVALVLVVEHLYQPRRLLQAMLRAKVWRKPKPVMQRELN